MPLTPRTRALAPLLALYLSTPAAALADNANEPHGDEGALIVLSSYTSTTTLGVGSTVGTALVLLSSIQGRSPGKAERRAALRIYVRESHHELDAALALGAGEPVESLAMIMGVAPQAHGAFGLKLRAARGEVRRLATAAREDDEALDALFALLEG